MLSIFLTLHITGSFVFIAYVFSVLGMLLAGKGSITFVRRGAVAIGVHQVLTGLALGFLSPNMTLLAVCVRGLALVAVLYAVSYATVRRLAFAQQEIS